MSNKTKLSKSLSVAVGAAFVGAFTMAPAAQASNFQMNDLDQGYQLVGDNHDHGDKAKEEGKCGEGKCGADKKAEKEGKCGEGKCGEGKCGGDKAEHEGKCGEGKCGAEKKDKEGSCGGMR
ncbi:MAG: hypothetical protein KDI75_01565 [Xanthomonadales bacterium]|nr:hypothetical protein [Xanthomonadales bacterium]